MSSKEKKLGNLALDFGVLSEAEQNLRIDALKELNILCGQVFDISFNALALTGEITDYDSRCPFKGLKPFRKEDQDFFRGRESLIEKLRQKLKKHNFLAVLGASGTGKSSVVLAGLIPVLEEQESGIKIIEFTPDNRPRERLQEQLLGVEGESLVVVVDQFEEVFTLCEKTNRENFIAELLKLAEDHKVIVTMRADFWGECAENEELKQVMLKNQELISPMNAEELRKAIEEQAEKVGLRFESGVVNLIEKDVESAPGEMPLLQYALEQLWQRRRGKWLLSEEYKQIGFKEAIARTADSFYNRLSETEKEQVKNIFLRLTRLDESLVLDEQPKYTRQRIYLKNLTTTDNFHTIEKLVQRLAGEEARLVVTRTEFSGSGGDGKQQITVEVAHEALITHWPKLQGWLDENRTNLQLRQSIREADLEWRKHYEESFLLHYGNRLAGAEALLQERGFLNESEITYVNACISKQRDEQERELLQERKARRAAQRTTRISIAAAILVAGLGLHAVIQEVRIEINKVDTLTATSLSLLDTGKELDAFINAIKAAKSLQRYKFLQKIFKIDKIDKIFKIFKIFKIDTKTESEVIDRLSDNLDRGSEHNRLEGHDNRVYSVSFSPDDKTLASASVSDNTIKLWDVNTGKEKHIIPFDDTYRVSFSPDGKILASVGDNTVKLWDVNTGGKKNIIPLDEGVNRARFSPDGQILASASSKNFKLWDVNTGEKIRTIPHDDAVDGIRFSPNGKILASRSKNTIKLWDVNTGEKILTIPHDDAVDGIRFSPNGKILASLSKNTVKLWDVNTGKEKLSIKHDDAVDGIIFSPKGEILAFASDNTVKLWDVKTGKKKLSIPHDSFVSSVIFSPDSQILASGDDDTVKLWDVKTGKKIRTLPHDSFVSSVSFSSNGEILASVSDNTVKLWNVKTQEEKRTFKRKNKFQKVFFSPDPKPKIIHYSFNDNTIKLWDVNTGKEIL
ncbi:WD40 repeat domain-containing protein, partial [Trichodesmium erythraeum 21-75]|nr:WD40 repeat domain-containing protein [Trichodesmium erythraeum 21-75]